MYLVHVSLMLHFVGIGFLCTSLFGGFVLHRQYSRARDLNEKLGTLRALRALGLFSPVGVILMLLTGLGNMTLGAHRYSILTDSWLSIKLVIVLCMILLGVLLGLQGTRRTRLVKSTQDRQPTDDEQRRVSAIDTQLLVLYGVQTLLLLSVIMLSVIRPS